MRTRESLGSRKDVATGLLVLVCAVVPAWGGELGPDLEAVLAETGPHDTVAAIVLMESFPDEKELLEEVRGLAPHDRRARVVKRMRDAARSDQLPVRALLAQVPSAVDDVRVLWGINGVALRATPDVLQRLARLSEVRVVLHDVELPREEVMDFDQRLDAVSSEGSESRTRPLDGAGAGPSGGDVSGPNPNATVAPEVAAMGAPRVWDELGHTGAGVVVAVLDTGVDRTHPDLADHVWTNTAEAAGEEYFDDDDNGFVDDTWGWDFCGRDNDPDPGSDSHGTKAAGQVAGDGTGDGTEAIVTGVAPDAEIMALKIDCLGSSWFEASDYAIANGAHIISQSMGQSWSSKPDYGALRRQAVTELAAGLIHANSTGNNGVYLWARPIPYNISSPGDCPPPWIHPDQVVVGGVTSVIGVANIDWHTDSIDASSPYGPSAWDDIRANTDPDYPHDVPAEYRDYPYENGAQMGLLKPDIAAYGQNTTSICPLVTDDFYCPFGGTSSAAPHIAGVLALMLSANPQATPEQLTEAILTTAQHRGDPGKNNRQGVGLVQAYDAVRAVTCDAVIADFTATPNPGRGSYPVLFDSDVDGGSVPYDYHWDFDGDGIVDSTEEDPTWTFRRPFEGTVWLRAEDMAGCLETVGRRMSVTGPDLRYDSFIALNEVEGNGNGGVDPGEIWELNVNLRNDGSELAEGVSAELAVDPATPGAVDMLHAGSTYGEIDVGTVAASHAAYRFRVGSGFPCGEDIVLTVTSITSRTPSNTYPDQPAVIRILVGATGPGVSVYETGFETDADWVAEDLTGASGEWQRDAPSGLGTVAPDPASAYEGDHVWGNDLTGLGQFPGDYENNSTSVLKSPPIWVPDDRDHNLQLRFARWLNVESGDAAEIWVRPSGFSDGIQVASWTNVTDADEGWRTTTVDISDVADGYGGIEVELLLRTDGSGTSAGWNIDLFEVLGTPEASCERYGPYLRYRDYRDLTEIEGNGDGVLDPGELWDLKVILQNDGAQPAADVTADLVVDPATSGSVFMVQGSSAFLDVGVGETQSSSSAYRFRIADDYPCGAEIYLSVVDITSGTPADTYPDASRAIRLPVGTKSTLFSDYFETDLGWQDLTSFGDGEWERGVPQGLGSGYPDPTSTPPPFGIHAIGNDLTGKGDVHGDYENDVASMYASPWFEIPANAVEIEVRFYSWVNVDKPDIAHLDVQPYQGPSSRIAEWSDHFDTSWRSNWFDVVDAVRGAEQMRVLFGIWSDAAATSSGWNVDGLRVEGCSAETFHYLPGEATDLKVSKGSAGSLELEWSADCGAATTYGVYRGDLRVGYDSIVAEPGTCNTTATFATVPVGAGDAEFFLVVPNKDGEEGSYGTDSSGRPRPSAAGGCYPQGAVDVCAP